MRRFNNPEDLCIRQARLLLVSISLLLSMGSGCSEDDVGSGPATTCSPGAAVDCVCVDGASGVQTCNDDGASFGACECESEPDTPMDAGEEGNEDAEQDVPGDEEDGVAGEPSVGEGTRQEVAGSAAAMSASALAAASVPSCLSCGRCTARVLG